MERWLEPLAGGLVLLITLLDVFLTVLYARAGTGLLAPLLARGIWAGFRGLCRGKYAGWLSFCGPVQLVALVLMWGVLLAVGSGLIIHPALGTGVRSGSDETDTGFVTATFVGGSSMSIVGASDFRPASPGYKLLFLFNSLVGMSVTSLTLAYLMQVYTALRSRNTVGLKMQAQNGETGDAAELLARWSPRGRLDGVESHLSTLAGELAEIKEMHHFYPVLFYFRFEQALYAPSRILLIALDTVTLIRTVLDPREAGWLRESAALIGLDRTATMLLRTLNQTFPVDDRKFVGSPESRKCRRVRYERALQRLQEVGLPTRADWEIGAREYVELRAAWEPCIEALAHTLGYDMEDIDGAAKASSIAAAAVDPDGELPSRTRALQNQVPLQP
jgi:hypothetical protein